MLAMAVNDGGGAMAVLLAGQVADGLGRVIPAQQSQCFASSSASSSGMVAGLAFPVHPHMLRHSTGFKLANDGQDTRAIQHYLGHKNIQHTVRYTDLSCDRFKEFWDD